jgi:hypothetical protein
MPDQFQSLIDAMLRDDRDRVNELLKQDAALARTGATDAHYASRIAHWVYAGDTALHVAAAGYRVEIANQIIQAFLERGISPGLKDGKGKSVLAWAKSDWIREILAGNVV